MKNLWTRLKNAPQRTLSALKRHGVTVYCCFIVFLLSLCLLTVQDIKNTKEVLKLQKEQQVLLMELEEVSSYSIEQLDLIQEQTKIINKYENTLQTAKGFLDEQGMLIRDLINYLKKIGRWPPKEPRPTEPPVDRDKWASINESI
jgi:hypothetical protein